MKYTLLLIVLFFSLPATAQSPVNALGPSGAQLAQQLLQQQQQGIGGNAQGAFGAPPAQIGVINQYDQKYKGGKKASKGTESLIPTGQFKAYFVRRPDDSQGITALRIEAAASVQGCATATIPPAMIEKRGINLWVTIEEPKIQIDKNIRNPHYECATAGGVPTLDVEFNSDDLMDDKLEYVVMQTGSSKDKFELEVTEDFIRLTPSTQTAFQLTKGTHYFYPDNTVILHVPQSNQVTDLGVRISSIADKHNLKMADFGPSTPGLFYYVDAEDTVISQLDNQHTIKLDTIEIDDIFLGSNGEYTVTNTVDVFAFRPGEND